MFPFYQRSWGTKHIIKKNQRCLYKNKWMLIYTSLYLYLHDISSMKQKFSEQFGLGDIKLVVVF